jgi:hypothetical protein
MKWVEDKWRRRRKEMDRFDKWRRRWEWRFR